jgi:hypothetical protein
MRVLYVIRVSVITTRSSFRLWDHQLSISIRITVLPEQVGIMWNGGRGRGFVLSNSNLSYQYQSRDSLALERDHLIHLPTDTYRIWRRWNAFILSELFTPAILSKLYTLDVISSSFSSWESILIYYDMLGGSTFIVVNVIGWNVNQLPPLCLSHWS